MPTIKTVKPAGGGDFMTLADWWNARKTSGNADEWAECYGGGDLGSVDLTGMTATPNATHYPRIYAAAGQRHNGVSGGCFIAGSVAVAGITVQTPFTHIEGLRYQGVNNLDRAIAIVDVSNVQIEALLSIDAAFSAIEFNAQSAARAISGNWARNCIARGSAYPYAANTFDGAASCACQLDNCVGQTNSDPAGNAFSPYAEATSGTATTTMTLKNCVGINSAAGDFTELTGGMGGTENSAIVASHCVSEDATADDFGGSGNLINQDPDDLFEDPASGNFQPKASCALIAAGVNLSSDFTTDMLGSPRPPAGPWDIGALMFVATYDINYTYDPLGNRIGKNAGGALTAYTYDLANQLKTSLDASGVTTYTFDANGNQRLVMVPSGQITTTTWNYENQPYVVELPSGARVTTLYNADNRRVVKIT